MRIIQIATCSIEEISSLELVAIKKIIGKTSHSSRMKDFGLSEEEARAAEGVYNEISDFLHKLGK